MYHVHLHHVSHTCTLMYYIILGACLYLQRVKQNKPHHMISYAYKIILKKKTNMTNPHAMNKLKQTILVEGHFICPSEVASRKTLVTQVQRENGLQHLWAELAKGQQGGDTRSLSRSMPMPCKRKCFRSRWPDVAESYKIPKRWMVILEDLPSNISGSIRKDWKKIQLLVFLAGPTRPCQISASPPSCKASRPFLKAAAATQRGMERKTCCSVSSNDKLCGQRQASAPEVWWCRIKSDDFL